MNITIIRCDNCHNRIYRVPFRCEICPDDEHFHKKCVKKVAGIYCCKMHAEHRSNYAIVYKYITSTVKSLDLGVVVSLDELISKQSVIIHFSDNEIYKLKAFYSEYSNAIVIEAAGKTNHIGLHDHNKFKKSFKDLCIDVIKYRIHQTEKDYKSTLTALNNRKAILSKLEANKT